MKRGLSFKKRKFQYGGAVGGGYTSFTLNPDVQVSPSVFSTFKMYETAQLPIIDKSSLKPEIDLSKLKGHRNEVEAVYKKKEALDKQLASLSDLDILGNSERFKSIMSEYNSLLSPKVINELAVSKEYSERAYDAAQKKNTFGEVNVRDGKFMMKAGDGTIAEVPLDMVDAYLLKGFQFMTTAELFHERDTNENLAFNYQIDNRLSYGLSADELRKRFREQLAVGSNETGAKGESYRFVKKVIDDIGSKDVFEESVGGGRKIKDNYKQLEFALKGIIASMSQEERDTLTGLVTRRLANARIPITSENIANEMYAYLLDLKESKKEFSDLKESFTRLGSRITGSASGSSQPKVEIGAGAMAVMGMGTVDNRTIMKGNNVIQVRGTQFPVKEDYTKGSGDNERFVTLSETNKLKHGVNMNNIRLLNGAKIQANEFVINPGVAPLVTFAYRDKTGKYLIGDENAKRAEAVFKNAVEKFIQNNPNASAKQFEDFKAQISQRLLKDFSVEQVIMMEGWVPESDERKRNMKEGVEYFDATREDNPQVHKAFESKGTKKEYYFIPEYMRTQVIMPAAPMSVIRTMIDEDKVYTKVEGLQDQGSLAVMEQQGLTSGRTFQGFGIDIFE